MDEKSKLEFLNVSKKYNYFIWMPAKCGTTHAADIFKNFDKNFIHSHVIELFNGHWSYDLISLQRNPYARYASMFNNLVGHEKSLGLNKVRDNFDLYLNSVLQSSGTLKDMLKYHERTPDYFIKLEQLFEDYSKIPFVIETDFYKSGQLKLECSIPKNESQPDSFSWKELYTSQTADLVYYNMSLIFDLCDYDKNSWKS
jgi:hypothetical protein